MTDSALSFVRAYPPAAPPAGTALSLLFRGGELIVREQGDGIALLTTQETPARWTRDNALYLGTLDGVPVLTDELASEVPLPDGLRAVSLRALFGQVSEAEYAIAGYATQMLNWRRTSKHCPVCGHLTDARDNDWGRKCPNCGHVSYPHVTPAVLILVHHEGQILLGHKPGWGPRFSILAGFVEPNESLEDCVRREVMEEVSVSVSALEYMGSQAWPFPHQVMIGFRARYASGTIKADEEELDDARWFAPDQLPDLPPPVSLSRQMIDAWVAEQS